MNPTPGLQRIRRILVAVDACTHSVSALEAAVQLAAQLHAELVGLFVEDTNLLRLAALPFAREWGTTTLVRRMESTTMDRALRHQAQQMQQLLARSAAQHQVRWSFQVARGEIAAQVRQVAEEVDLVTLGINPWEYTNQLYLETATRKLLRDSLRPMLLLPQGVALQSPLICLYTGTPAAQHALELAKHLSAPHQPMTVVIASNDPQNALRLREQAAQFLAEQAVQWQHCQLTVAAILARLRLLPAGTVLLPADATSLPERERDMLLAKSQRAVIVVQ
jgi:nucleotide-binding universal stress UspA family protein